MKDTLNQLADEVVIASTTGNPDLYQEKVGNLVTAVRALAAPAPKMPMSDNELLALAEKYGLVDAASIELDLKGLRKLAAAIESRASAAPQQEPVGEVVSSHAAGLYDELPKGTLLYAAPVQEQQQAAQQEAGQARELSEDAIEALMHKHGLINIAGDNPNLEAKLISFARDVEYAMAAPSAPAVPKRALQAAIEQVEGALSLCEPEDLEAFEDIKKALASQPAAVPDERPTAADAGDLSQKQEKLLALADRIDHEKLWRLAGMDHYKLTADQKDRMLAGIMLRRYADIWKAGHWVIVPPTGGIQFGASTLDEAVEMAKRDEARRANRPTAVGAVGLASAPAQPTVPLEALATEAAKLAGILHTLTEGGGEERNVDIYASDYQPGDGDVYVIRAAQILHEIAAAAPVAQGSKE